MGATNPVIAIVGPDDTATATELIARYGRDYTVSLSTSVEEAVEVMRTLAADHRDVALVLADRRCGGGAVLDAAKTLHPHARRGLLLDWNESRTDREAIAEAFARRQAECFVARPAGTPDERFHRNVTELLDEWWRLHGSPTVNITVVGPERSARIHEICDALHRHNMPYRLHSPDSDAGRGILNVARKAAAKVPVIVVHGGQTLVDPTNVELANALGARTRAGEGVYDVIVVGGGPAGLSAAVYAESEGLRTALIETIAMGGQAGTSSMIRNYLGFPRGISGADLAARAFDQAILFGTEMVYGSAAASLCADGDIRIVGLTDGTEVRGRAVVIATGVSYRRLGIPSLEALAGVGVFYGAAMSEAASMAGEHVYVLGGGNSAGQAAVHLAKFARRVTIVVRGDLLAASMSDYLITEIDATPNVDVRYRTEIVDGHGNGRLEVLELRDRDTGAVETVHAAGLFVLIGAEPFTGWLPPSVARDEWGYVITGPSDDDPRRIPFESQMPGVFAVGDVRRDSIKRVASAVGEGAVCVRLVHDYLASIADAGSSRI